MEPWQWWWPGMGFMWIFPLIFMLVMIVFVLRGSSWCGHGHGKGGRHETARDILDRRHASGEIDKQQYEEIRRTIER